MEKKISQLRSTTYSAHAQQTNQHAIKHWSSKSAVPPGVFFRHINNRSIGRWHPQATREVKIFGQRPDQEDPPSKTNQATIDKARSVISRMANPNHITTIFSHGVPNCFIISGNHKTKEQEAKVALPLEALTTMHITLSQKDSFHGEPLMF